MPELKDFLIVGILGSLWMKVVEWYFWLSLGFVNWGTLATYFGFAQFVYLVLISGAIGLVFCLVLFKDKTKGFSMVFIPVTWYYVKDISNVIFGHMTLNSLLHTFFEGILIAIPIGFFVYYFYWKTKGVGV